MFLQQAFSLIELMITLFIMTLLIAIGLPAYKQMQIAANEQVLQSVIMQFIASAREEALLQRVPVIICKSNNQHSCVGDWRDGLLMFSDDYADGHVRDKTQIMQVKRFNKSMGKLFWRSYPFHHEDVVLTADASSNGTFWYCQITANHPAWAIALSKTERARLIYPNKQGEIRDHLGKLLAC